MSFDRRFELPTWEDADIDLTICETCPHRFHECWDAGYCLVDEGDQDE